MITSLDLPGLAAVITRATELPAQVGDGGVIVKFPPGHVISAQRAALLLQGTTVRLRVWPAELAPQYKKVYSSPDKIQALLALVEPPDWTVEPNFHLSYWLAAPKKRWYPIRHLSPATYLHQWIHDFHGGRAGRRPVEELKNPRFIQWLLERRYATDNELAGLDEWADTLPRDHFDIRPGAEVTRSWQIADAVERHQAGTFAHDVRDSLNQILIALGESPLLF